MENQPLTKEQVLARLAELTAKKARVGSAAPQQSEPVELAPVVPPVTDPNETARRQAEERKKLEGKFETRLPIGFKTDEQKEAAPVLETKIISTEEISTVIAEAISNILIQEKSKLRPSVTTTPEKETGRLNVHVKIKEEGRLFSKKLEFSTTLLSASGTTPISQTPVSIFTQHPKNMDAIKEKVSTELLNMASLVTDYAHSKFGDQLKDLVIVDGKLRATLAVPKPVNTETEKAVFPKQLEKELAIAKLRETIQLAARELEEIDRELAEIRAGKEKNAPLEKDREENPFKYFILDKIASKNLQVIFPRGITMEAINHLLRGDGQELAFFNPDLIIPGRDEAITFSTNGFYLKIKNRGEVQSNRGVDISSPKAKYDLIGPDGKIILKDIDYDSAQTSLHEAAQKYQDAQLAEFENQNKKD